MMLDGAYGMACSMCGSTDRLVLHRLDTMPHRQFTSMSLGELNDITENHKDDYVRLCHSCHMKEHAMINKELALPTSI